MKEEQLYRLFVGYDVFYLCDRLSSVALLRPVRYVDYAMDSDAISAAVVSNHDWEH